MLLDLHSMVLKVGKLNLNCFLHPRCDITITTKIVIMMYRNSCQRVICALRCLYAKLGPKNRERDVFFVQPQGSRKCGSMEAALLGNSRPNWGNDANWEKKGKQEKGMSTKGKWGKMKKIKRGFTRLRWRYGNCTEWNKIVQIQRNNYSWLY